MLVLVKFDVRLLTNELVTQCRFVNTKDDSEANVCRAVGIQMERIGVTPINDFSLRMFNNDIWAIQSWLMADGTSKEVMDIIGHLLFFTGNQR
jgi:hypothetical protein